MLATDEGYQQVSAENASWAAALAPALAQTAPVALAAVEQRRRPESPEAVELVSRFARACAEALGRRDGPTFRAWLAHEVDVHTDPRAERYWRLVGRVGTARPPIPQPPFRTERASRGVL